MDGEAGKRWKEPVPCKEEKLWTEQSLQAGMDFAAEKVAKNRNSEYFLWISERISFQRRKRHLSYRVFIKQVEKKSNGQRKDRK